MSDNNDTSLAGKAALAAGAAIGSAAIAAALLFAKRRSDRKKADAKPGATSTAPHYPIETD
jgi:Na+/H+-translocating membrane pyrophosphatase